MSEKIPWTDPGGTPCCCAVCTNTEMETAFAAGQIGARHWSSSLSPDISISDFFQASTSQQFFPSTFELTLRRDFVLGANTITWLASTSLSALLPVSYSFNNPFSKSSNSCRSAPRIYPGPPSVRIWRIINGDESGAAYANRDVSIGFPGTQLLFIQDGGSGYPHVNDGPPTAAQPKIYGAGGNFLQLSDGFFGAFFTMQLFFDNDETRASNALTGNITFFGETVKWGHTWNPGPEFSATIEAHIAIPPAP